MNGDPWKSMKNGQFCVSLRRTKTIRFFTQFSFVKRSLGMVDLYKYVIDVYVYICACKESIYKRKVYKRISGIALYNGKAAIFVVVIL